MVPESLSQAWHEITSRPDGPLAIRFYLQPLVATGLAVRDGIEDARAGRPAYFWSLFGDRSRRRERLLHGWGAVKNVFIVALVIDVIYQLVVFKAPRPIEGLLVAAVLAIVPYLLVRGPVNRIARRLQRRLRRRPSAPRDSPSRPR